MLKRVHRLGIEQRMRHGVTLVSKRLRKSVVLACASTSGQHDEATPTECLYVSLSADARYSSSERSCQDSSTVSKLVSSAHVVYRSSAIRIDGSLYVNATVGKHFGQNPAFCRTAGSHEREKSNFVIAADQGKLTELARGLQADIVAYRTSG